MRKITLVLVTVLLCALSAAATDGVVEINHTCATNTGCFPGDSAGYPVRIDGSAGHSYTLTSDLAVTDVNTEVITVVAENVSIDLNGFEILGPVTCTGAGATLSCSGFGGGSGVGGGLRGMNVHNGSIKGVGRFGVHLGRHGEARNLRVKWSGIKGIVAGDGSTVSDNVVALNADNGIEAGDRSLVTGNTSTENGGDGITAQVGSLVRANTSSLNGGDGVLCEGTMVHDNSITSNTGKGLNLLGVLYTNGFRGNLIIDNTAGQVAATVLFQDLGGNHY
jgi:hypothetical protein